MSQGVYSRNYIDHMYASNESIREGGREFDRITENCPTEVKVGMAVGGLIGGGIGAAIPPYGAFAIPGICVGVAVGGYIGAKCRNERHQ